MGEKKRGRRMKLEGTRYKKKNKRKKVKMGKGEEERKCNGRSSSKTRRKTGMGGKTGENDERKDR